MIPDPRMRKSEGTVKVPRELRRETVVMVVICYMEREHIRLRDEDYVGRRVKDLVVDGTRKRETDKTMD